VARKLSGGQILIWESCAVEGVPSFVSTDPLTVASEARGGRGGRIPLFVNARPSNAQSRVLVIALVKEPRLPRRLASRRASSICQRGEGTSVTSTICISTLHDIVHVLVANMVRAFPSEGRTTPWVRRHCNLARALLLLYYQYLPVRTCTHS
jgi:hypothetical protein